MLTACAKTRESWQVSDGARIGGVHYYGPYFAEPKVGCHLKDGRRNPDPREYRGIEERGSRGRRGRCHMPLFGVGTAATSFSMI